MPEDDFVGQYSSPGGFVFGVQGWDWGSQKPCEITFFVGCGKACCSDARAISCPHEGRCKVSDQHGRPIKGTVDAETNQPVYFDKCSHAKVIAALLKEDIDVIAHMNAAGLPCTNCKGERRINNKWCLRCYHKPSGESTGLMRTVIVTGWPQLPYKELQKIKLLPSTPVEELRKIANADLRRDALKYHGEMVAKVRDAAAIEM